MGSNAQLQAPPVAIVPQQLVAAAIPDAWQNGQANISVVSGALSGQSGKPLPWLILREAVDAGLQGRWFELSPDSGPWPCDFPGARNVVIKIPGKEPLPPPSPADGVLTTEATLEAYGIQDLAEQIGAIVKAAAGNNLKIKVRIELGGETAPPADVVTEVNALLAQISDALRFHQQS